MEIKLNLVNNVGENWDRFDQDVVMFQKNIAPKDGRFEDDLPTAWQVFEDLRPGDHHPFTYEPMKINARDGWGNHTPHFDAQPGQQFSMEQTLSEHRLEDRLILKDTGKSSQSITATNNLDEGDYTFQLYRSGKLLAQSFPLTPGQTTNFQFKNTLWIGLVSTVREGDTMNSAIINNIHCELPLDGVASADIVMTGSVDPSSDIVFTMQNIVMAEQDSQP